MKSQSGFLAVLLLYLLPLAMSLLMTLFVLKAWLAPQEEALQICRSGLIRTLHKTGLHIQELLQLNSQVELLRQQKRIAIMEMEAAVLGGNTAVAAMIQGQLDSILAEQKTLSLLQKEKLISAQIQLDTDEKKVENRIHQAFDETIHRYKDYFIFKAALLPHIPSSLALREIPPPDGGPPIYEPESNFSEKQTVHVNWISSLHSPQKGQNRWLSPFFEKKEGCAVSLQPQGKRLVPVLKEVRSSSNSS
jgi:hypothetical protein